MEDGRRETGDRRWETGDGKPWTINSQPSTIDTIFESMKWINIIGLCLQFLAFWLAAPELLGAETMKRFEKGLVSIISKLPGMLFGFLGFGLGMGMGVYGFYTGMQGDKELVYKSMYIMGTIMVVYVVFMVFFYKKLQIYLQTNVAEPLIEKLINNNQSRKMALVFGAVLFTLGFVFQLLALIIS